MGARVRPRTARRVPIDLVLVAVVRRRGHRRLLRRPDRRRVLAVLAAVIIVFVLGSIVWTFARRSPARRALDERQRKVGHDGSWTSGREEE